MVCHESYKDKYGNWLYPDEVKKVSKTLVVKKEDNEKVTVGPPESMSKSKKNTVDPEEIINLYGADYVRWFILSDSPPEKDVQWSDSGVISSNKFLQKIWNLNQTIINREEVPVNKELNLQFNSLVNNLALKIDKSIEEFKFNVSIAHFYEVYNLFNKYINKDVGNDCLRSCIINVMKLMIPFVPHLANECLELLDCRDPNIMPDIKGDLINNVKLAVQVNGKTRDVITIKKDSGQTHVDKLVQKNLKTKKIFLNNKILKIIFVKNRIINYIIK